jgi:hypothetical protein
MNKTNHAAVYNLTNSVSESERGFSNKYDTVTKLTNLGRAQRGIWVVFWYRYYYCVRPERVRLFVKVLGRTRPNCSQSFRQPRPTNLNSYIQSNTHPQSKKCTIGLSMLGRSHHGGCGNAIAMSRS